MTNLKFIRRKALLLLFPFLIFSCGDSEDGMDGINGLNILFNISDEPSGSNCSNGGLKIEYGQDIDESNILDSSEIQGTSFICNGASADQVLVITVDEPEGENCLDGGVKILVGIDDNANGTLETEEVDNISFICDGEVSAVQGKTFLVLSGDITNEEAAIKIAQEFGPNTQFVSILFTTQLTTVDLSMATNLVEVRIESNEALETVDLSNLVSIDDGLDVFENSLTSIDLNSLETSRFVSFVESGLTSLDLSNLTRAASVFFREPQLTDLSLGLVTSSTIDFEDGALTNLDLSSLVDTEGLELNIFLENLSSIDINGITQAEQINIGSTSLTAIDMSNLVTCGRLTLFENSQLSSVNLDNLMTVDETLSINSSIVPNLDLSNLTSVGRLFIGSNGNLIDVDVSKVIDANSVSIIGNLNLMSVDFDNLETVSEDLIISSNEQLNSINLTSLVSVANVNIAFNELLSTLNLDDLMSSDFLMVTSNSSLNTLDLASLSSVGFIDLSSNNLSAINLDAWSASVDIGTSFTAQFAGNNLDSSVINYLLSVLVGINPTLMDGRIDLRQFNSPAPPTGQGLIDVSTLESNGNTVDTD